MVSSIPSGVKNVSPIGTGLSLLYPKPDVVVAAVVVVVDGVVVVVVVVSNGVGVIVIVNVLVIVVAGATAGVIVIVSVSVIVAPPQLVIGHAIMKSIKISNDDAVLPIIHFLSNSKLKGK